MDERRFYLDNGSSRGNIVKRLMNLMISYPWFYIASTFRTTSHDVDRSEPVGVFQACFEFWPT